MAFDKPKYSKLKLFLCKGYSPNGQKFSISIQRPQTPSHTLRKIWGLRQRDRGTPIPILMEAFGHTSQQQTMQYLGIQAEEIAQIYEMDL
ncbi:hypothetical protein DXZ20_00015 [Leptolyngbyaceae cyanobacterium CCMR0081]|uniref:Tyr recombinase domain-containing protein n=1 Tax=Adonisia turfae CCMR0081 TaxID=2292702 RepID=A0A6M0RCK6_9CYAN|nr:hypothetical protein [Adonisia turfae CCMR0081]